MPGKPDEDAVLSLLEELSILRRLRHPAFLEVMAACHVTHPDHVTLVFQSVPHGSLYHHLHVMVSVWPRQGTEGQKALVIQSTYKNISNRSLTLYALTIVSYCMVAVRSDNERSFCNLTVG